ncbi:T9SS type A sorting domain-containing protein [Hymenobacter amundsenii]|uniref:T9SS type A sorting domain-containing protein n=1 Tax=Hymenobacter amundsenii TaxID=2006685 RepID=UPI001A8ECDCC|nr:T9SS type A sorting domain-containing protein [Hymenobacter amundsenii]
MPLSLVGNSIRLRVNLASQAPANYRAGVVVRRQGGVLNLLNINLAGVLVIRTLKKSGSTSVVQESIPVSAELAGLVLGGSGSDPVRLEFVATKPFDQIEIEAGALLALGYKLDVFYAYAIDANVINTAQGYLSRFDAPSTSNYSTESKDNGITLCVNSNVSNPLNAVDNSLTNYATMGSLVDLSCPTTLQTQLEGTAPAGYDAGFVIGNGGLLDVSILKGLRLTTYLNGVAQESSGAGDLLSLKVLPGGQYAINFPTTKRYDRVEIRRTSLLGVLDNLRVYYGFGLEPRVFRDVDPLLSQFANPAGKFEVTTSSAVVCVNCSITDPQLAADNDLKNNYATVQTTLSVGGTVGLKMRLDGAGQAGNTAGVILGSGTELLDLNVLSNIRVRTYTGTPTSNGNTDGSVLVESATGSALLRLELLADGRQEISFLTTRDFDWVEVEFANGVSLLNDTRIYYGFAEDRPTGFPTNIVAPPAPLPVQLTAFNARANELAVDVTWKTAAEVNSDYFEVERSVTANQGFVTVGRVQAAGNTSSGREYALRDNDARQLPAGVLYYRLRQVDVDGTQVYSAVAVVTRKAAAVALVLYPNPAGSSDLVQVTLGTLPSADYEVAIYSLQGSLVSQQSVSARKTTIAVQGLRAGIYQVILRNAQGQQVATQRLALSGR